METKTGAYIQDCLRRLERTDAPDLVTAFEQASKEFASDEAYRSLGKSITFSEVDAASRDFAAYLIGECGLQKGDRIAIQLPNLTQYPVVAWGALRAGLVIVNTNPLYTEREVAYQLNDSGAVAAIILDSNLPLMERLLATTGVRHVIATNVIDMLSPQPLPETAIEQAVSLPAALARGSELELPATNIELGDIALLQYTGGTTGAPKGAVLTHGNVFAAALMSPLSFGADLSLREVSIAPMPLYHIYGFAVNLISGYLNGSLSILVPNPRDIDALIATMRERPFTSFAGVNTLFTALMQHPDFDAVDYSELRWTISGGAATVPEVAKAWQERTGAPIHEGYGLSETVAMATVNSLQSRRLGTIGPPMVGSEFRVVDDAGQEVPQGTEGELLIRGPQIMQGYWNKPEETAAAIDADGWFHSGDIAVIEDDGHIRIVDRLKDMVLVSGFNVYPNEVESVVYEHPDVIECAVVGVPDDASGEAVKLFVASRRADLTAAELQAHCREQLTAYKVPKHVAFLAELPKSAVGKVLRRELRGK